ncbi:hypothetical protein DFJ74DRAFT_648619 [Hyaloraphidium curvatum]|nr:hypothetical protein DFJ74DRAFT_648619 [Hyaloraphidium curvatum]
MSTDPVLLAAWIRALLGDPPSGSDAPDSAPACRASLAELAKHIDSLRESLEALATPPDASLAELSRRLLDLASERARTAKQAADSVRLRAVNGGQAVPEAGWKEAEALSDAVSQAELAFRASYDSEEALYEITEFSFPLPDSKDPRPDVPAIKLKLRMLRNPTATYGLSQWGAGLQLANLLCTRRIELRSPVVELGCGSGTSGLVAASLLRHPGAVTLTDANRIVVANVARNIDLNGLSDFAEAARYDWSSAPPPGVANALTVIAADVAYDLECGAALPTAVRAVLRRDPRARFHVVLPRRLGFETPLAVFTRGMDGMIAEWAELGSIEGWDEGGWSDGFVWGTFRWSETDLALSSRI